MMDVQKFIKTTVAFALMSCSYAVQTMNLLMPYDVVLRPPFNKNAQYQLMFMAEGGLGHVKGFNGGSHRTNVLSIWQEEQNALTMLDGFNPMSPIGQLRNSLDAADNGVRGHFLASAALKLKFAGSFGFRGRIRNGWSITSYLPFFSMKLDNVAWQDLTQNLTAEDQRVKRLLTNNIFANVAELGGLDIQHGWHRTGIGDWTTFAEWDYDFRQYKPVIRNVHVNARLGITIPTGLKENENLLFAIPFGNDGAIGFPFGAGIELLLGSCLIPGVYVQMIQMFGNTRLRRVRTSLNQTDILLLQKAYAYKDFGLTQQFDLYMQCINLIKGLEFTIAYEYYKHGDDEISLAGYGFSSEIANTSVRLFDWTMHHLVATAAYDFTAHIHKTKVHPQIFGFARVPFNGTRSALSTTLGLGFSIDF